MKKVNISCLYKSRKALAHVEMILSFVFFVGFLLFVFFMLTPLFRTQTVVSNDNEVRALVNNLSAPVGKLSVMVNNASDCFDVAAVSPYYGSSFVSVQKSFSPPFYYTLYYSTFFNPALVGVISCATKPGRNYTFGSYTEDVIFIEPRIFSLKQQYETNYILITQQLGVNNFAFEFYYLNKTRIDALSVNSSAYENTNIYSTDFPVRVMNQEAEFKEMIVRIITWR